MNAAALAQLPNWPTLMDVDTAILYLCNKKGIFQALRDGGYLEPLTDRHRCTTFRRSDIDAALAKAKAAGDQLEPSEVREPTCIRELYPKDAKGVRS